jgi:hypothetical protein
MLEGVIKELIEDLTEGLKRDIERYADRMMRRALRTLVLAGMGITFLAAGSFFMMVGVVNYLSQFIFTGFAWGIVGLVAALVGGALFLLIRR